MTQIRAADDFTAIRQRMKELAREAAEASAANAGAEDRAETLPTDRERRQKERREGHPPPWAPTIFAKPLAGRR